MPFFKTNHQSPTANYKLFPAETLLPLEKIISLAKKEGVNFGQGNAKERIRYFIKLGILPHAVRKTSRSSVKGQLSSVPTAHLPYWTVGRLIKIQSLTEKGLTFSQIAKHFANSQKKQDSKAKRAILEAGRIADFQKPIVQEARSINLFPKYGVSEDTITKKFREQETRIQNIITSQLAQTAGFASAPPRGGLLSRSLSILAISTFTLTISYATLFLAERAKERKQETQKLARTKEATAKLGQVLAASTERHKLYIDADTEVSGTTLFLEDITAPNIVYSVSGGTGIEVTGGQRPIVSLDETEIVTSVNDLAGDVDVKGSGGTTISTSGSTITISSTTGLTAEADTLATVTGRGATTSTASTFSGGLTVGGTLSLSDTNSTVNITNTGSLAFKDGTNTLFSILDQGAYGTIRLSDKGSTGDPATCLAGEIYFNDTDNTVNACTTTNTWEQLDNAASGMTSFNVSGDSGTDQTITDGNTLEIAGGVGITTAGSAGDILTVTFASTEVGTTIWGTGSAITWTFDASAGTDTTIAFGDNTQTLTTGTLTLSGTTTLTASSLTTITGGATAIDFTEFDVSASTGSVTINDSGDLGNITIEGTVLDINSLDFAAAGSITTTGAGTDLTLNPVDEVIFGDTNTFIVGGHAGGVAYNVLSNAGGAPGSASIDTDNDLYIQGSIEVDGASQFDGAVTANTDVTLTLAGTENFVVTGGASADSATTNDLAQITLTTPVDTTGTNIHNALDIDLTVGNASGGTNTANIINIGAITGDAEVTLRGLNIGNLTGTAATETAINVGTGWDTILGGTTAGTNLFSFTNASLTTAGALTVASCTGCAVATAWSAITNPTGSLSLTFDDAEVNTFTISSDTEDFWTFTAGSVTTGSLLVGTGPTGGTAGVTDHFVKLTSDVGSGGSILNLNPTFDGAAVAGYGIYLVGTDATTAANTDYGIFSSMTLTGDSDKTPYGIFSTVSNTQSTSGTPDTYGGYFSATGDTGGTSTSYGIYATASGADTNYAGQFLGTVSQTPSNPSYVGGGNDAGADASYSVFVSGRYAYVVKGPDTGTCSSSDNTGCELQVWDVSNPTSPTFVGGGNDAGHDAFLSVFVSGRYAYVGTGPDAGTCSSSDNTGCEFQVWDVSNPTSPTFVGGGNDAGENTFYSVFVSGRYAYAGKSANVGTCSSSDNTGCELQVWDVSNPTSPTFVGGGNHAGHGFFYSVFVSGRYAYAGTGAVGGYNELYIWDVSNPTSPTFVGGGNDAGGGIFYSVFVSGRYAYAGKSANVGTCSSSDNTGCELQVWDVSNPTSPTFVGGGNDAGGDTSLSVFVSGRYAYVGKGPDTGTCSSSDNTGCELQVWDITGIEATSVLAHSLEAGSLQVQANAFINNQLYVTGGLGVGIGGIRSSGPVSIYHQNTSTTGTTGNYGLYNQWTSSAVVTGTAQTAYGIYNTVTKTGNDTTSAQSDFFGTYSTASYTGTMTDAGTKNTYGGYFSATGDSEGTNTAYGLYATASGADTNWAGYFNGAISVTSCTGCGGGAAWDAIGDPSGNGAIAMGATTQTLDWGTLTTQTGLTLTGGSAQTSGTIFAVGNSSTKYVHTALNDTGSLVSLTLVDESTNANNGGTSNALNIASTINTSGAGTKSINAINIASPTVTACTTGACTYTGVNIGAISGAILGQGISIGNISSTGATNYGISLGTLTGGTTGNFQISTGVLTSAVTTANAQLNLGGIVTTNGTTSYGINIGALSGTGTTNYGINIAALTSTGTNYGLNIGGATGAATTNYGLVLGAVSGATNNYNLFSSTADPRFFLESTASTITTGVLDIDVTSATHQNSGLNLSYTFNSTTDSAIGYGIYESLTHSNASLTTNNTLYGQYLTFSDTTALANTNYGIFATVPVTGNAAKKTVGVYGEVTSNSTTADSLYGGYFKTSATGNAARTTNYGVIAYGQTSSTTGDTVFGAMNYGLGTGTIYGAYNIAAGSGGTSSRYATFSIVKDPGVITSGFAVYTGIGTYGSSAKTGADVLTFGGASNLYGAYGIASDTSTDAGEVAGTRATYGGYFSGTGAVSGTTTSVGVYATSGSGADTNIAIYGLATDSTVSTTNTIYGSFITATLTNSAPKIGYGNYGLVTSSSTTADSLYGGYFKTSATGNAARTTNYGTIAYGQTSSTTADSVYGIYGTVVSSGAMSTGTRTQIGVYGVSTASGATGGTASNTYGGYFNATGEAAGAAAGIAYGVFATASGGDATTTDAFVSGIAFRNDAVSTTALCWDASGASPILDCTSPPGDYTEVYPTESDVNYEEVVTIGQNETTVNHARVNEAGQTTSPETRTLKKLTKASKPYDENVIGVTSENWSDFSSIGKNDVRSEDNPKPVTLSGRVVVKVTDEGGPINAGDHLTTSSTPGAAMKADPRYGSTIGRALEAFTQSGEGRILIFVQTNSKYNLQTAFADIDLEALSFSTSSQNTAIDTFGNITTAGTIEAANGQFSVDELGNVTAHSLTANQLSASSLTVTGDAQIGGKLSAGSIETSRIETLDSSDLTIKLGDSLGVNNLTISNSNNIAILTVNSAGGATLAADGAYLSIPRGYICIDDDGACDVTGPVNGTIYADAFVTNSTADIAEAFPTTDETIEAGNIVAADPNNPEHLIKSHQPYLSTLLGIISTEPGITLNAGTNKGTNKVRPCEAVEVGPCQITFSNLALAGRVPTKVSAENGPINVGDPITSSSTAGVGMRADRAGRIVGIALEGYDGSEDTEGSEGSNTPSESSQPSQPSSPTIGTIVVFVEPGWYIGSALADNGSLPSSGQATTNSSLSTLTLTSGVNPDGTINCEQSTVNCSQNDYLTADEIRQLIAGEVERQLAQNEIRSRSSLQGPESYQYDSPIATDSATVEATSSSQLAQETDAALEELDELLATNDLSLSTLTVTGNSHLAQTQVAGTFSQDGTLVIDYGRQINVLGSTLFLQNDSLAGDTLGILVDIGSGTVTIDKEGNLEITGTLTARNIQTKELTIDTSDENAKTVGEGKISSGQNQVTIFTTAIKPDAKIFVTPTSAVQGRTLYISAKSEFEGFTVKVDGGTISNTVTFDWFIINTDKQVSEAN